MPAKKWNLWNGHVENLISMQLSYRERRTRYMNSWSFIIFWLLLWLQRQFFNKPVIKVVFKKKRKKEKGVLEDWIILNLKNTAGVMEYFHIFLCGLQSLRWKLKINPGELCHRGLEWFRGSIKNDYKLHCSKHFCLLAVLLGLTQDKSLG